MPQSWAQLRNGSVPEASAAGKVLMAIVNCCVALRAKTTTPPLLRGNWPSQAREPEGVSSKFRVSSASKGGAAKVLDQKELHPAEILLLSSVSFAWGPELAIPVANV